MSGLFNRKKDVNEQVRERVMAHAKASVMTQAAAQVPQRPTALEILKKRRSEKVEQVKRLNKEIEQLDHDVTWIETNPQGAHALEFIAARFGNGTEP